MVQGNPQKMTDIRQLGGEELPGLPRQFHGAEERNPGRLEAVGGAAGIEHPAVEGRIVGRQKLHVRQQRLATPATIPRRSAPRPPSPR